MNNYIMLEGTEMYVLIFLILTIAVIGVVGLASALTSDAKRDKLKDELRDEREKNIYLNRDNMRLKLKCGELKVGEKVDV